MEFIIDYSNENIGSIAHTSDSEASSKESIENNIESVDMPTESITKPKRGKTKKQLKALEKARIKATETIKAKNQKFKELIHNEEKERTDIEYVQEKFNYYKNLLNSFNHKVDEKNTKYKDVEQETRILTQDDLLILQMLNKY